jgi:hypothetical protein
MFLQCEQQFQELAMFRKLAQLAFGATPESVR